MDWLFPVRVCRWIQAWTGNNRYRRHRCWQPWMYDFGLCADTWQHNAGKSGEESCRLMPCCFILLWKAGPENVEGPNCITESGQMAAVFLYGWNTERTGHSRLLQDTFSAWILLSWCQATCRNDELLVNRLQETGISLQCITCCDKPCQGYL